MLVFAILLLLLAFCDAGQVEEVLLGHLEPLGNQIPPTVKIDEFTNDNMPTPEEFYNSYMQHSKAAIFRGAMEGTNAFKLWTDDYIKENYGELEVRLEAKKETFHVTPIGETYIGRDNLRHFVDNYHKNDSITYIVSELPEPMYKDHGVPAMISACGPLKDSFVEIDIWWSGGDSVSIIHKDAFNQLNCLINGTKYWKMFEYRYEKYLHKHWEAENQIGGFSDINVEKVDLKKHPNITKVPWSNFTINAGDCLYLPKSYYHQVNSVGTNNLAVSILFGRFDGYDSLDFSDCDENTDYKSTRPLSNFDVDWKWPGKGLMTMGKSDLRQGFQRELISMAKKFAENDIKFTSEMLQEFGIEDPEIGKKCLALFDLNKDGALTVEEIEKATRKELRQFSNAMEPNDPSNGYGFEHSFVSYDRVLVLLLKYMQMKPILKRDVWLKLYTKKLLGTETFGNEVFTNLAGSEEINEVKSDDIDAAKITKALENWINNYAEQYSNFNSVRKINQKYGLLDEEEEESGRSRGGQEEDDEEEDEDGDERDGPDDDEEQDDDDERDGPDDDKRDGPDDGDEGQTQGNENLSDILSDEEPMQKPRKTEL